MVVRAQNSLTLCSTYKVGFKIFQQKKHFVHSKMVVEVTSNCFFFLHYFFNKNSVKDDSSLCKDLVRNGYVVCVLERLGL